MQMLVISTSLLHGYMYVQYDKINIIIHVCNNAYAILHNQFNVFTESRHCDSMVSKSLTCLMYGSCLLVATTKSSTSAQPCKRQKMVYE